MQYLCIQTGWALLPECGPPTVFCAMKSHSHPLRGRDPDPIQILTITRPWNWLWESMPQPLTFLPYLAFPAIGGPRTTREWEMDMVGPTFPSFSPVARASFLLRVFPAQLCLALLPCPTRCC